MRYLRIKLLVVFFSGAIVGCQRAEHSPFYEPPIQSLGGVEFTKICFLRALEIFNGSSPDVVAKYLGTNFYISDNTSVVEFRLSDESTIAYFCTAEYSNLESKWQAICEKIEQDI